MVRATIRPPQRSAGGKPVPAPRNAWERLVRSSPRLGEIEREAVTAGKAGEEFGPWWEQSVPAIQDCIGFAAERWQLASRRLWLAWLCGDGDGGPGDWLDDDEPAKRQQELFA